MKRFAVFLLVFLVAASLVFAGGIRDSRKITLKTGDNYPDRNSGAGLVLERVNAEFKASRPNAGFAVESCNDQVWQEKAKTYAAANQLPDVFKWRSIPAMMDPFIKNGHIEKLSKSDFAAFGYLPGALESCERDGVLYGIPASGNMWVIYVNKSLFEKARVPEPETWEDVIASVPQFKARNITPLVTDGLEGRSLCIFFENITQRINGDFNRSYSAIDRTGGIQFTDPEFIQAATYVQNLVKAGVFNANLTVSDYGDARDQFAREKAAMYMAGSWEMGMAANTGFSQSFRDNLDVIKFPAVQSGKGTADNPMVWFDGNFVVSANSKNKALALEYIKFLAEKFDSYCWETGAGFPARKLTPRDSDSDLGKKLLQFSAEAKSISGKAPGLDYGKTDAFREEYRELMRQLCGQLIRPEIFCQKLDAAAEQASH